MKPLPNTIEKLSLGVLIDYRDYEGLTKLDAMNVINRRIESGGRNRLLNIIEKLKALKSRLKDGYIACTHEPTYSDYVRIDIIEKVLQEYLGQQAHHIIIETEDETEKEY